MEVPHQIPKIIHYCWFGKTSLPEDAQRCIASWKKFCPDYEIVEWNETKINLSALPLYVQQAYAAQKWAFVADYVRLYALIRYGGVYMDTDVELVAPLDRFMNQAAFAGFEDASHVATCVMACEPEFPLFKEFLLQYSNMQFLNPDGTLNTTTNVSRLTDICLERGMLQNGQCQSVAGTYDLPCGLLLPFGIGYRPFKTDRKHGRHSLVRRKLVEQRGKIRMENHPSPASHPSCKNGQTAGQSDRNCTISRMEFSCRNFFRFLQKAEEA